MRRYILYIMCMLCAVLTAGAREYTYESVKGDPTQTRIYTLRNGMKVYVSVNKEKPRVTAHIAVNTGSRNDPAETTGLAHYLEHLMFKGSTNSGTADYAQEKPLLQKISDLYEEYRQLTDPQERRAKYHEIDSVSQLAARFNIPNEYDKMMSAIGSQGSNAYTSYDVTCYTEDIPANELERWCIAQADRFQNMVMRGFHTELEAVYEEKNISLAKDWSKTYDAMMRLIFPSHPYGTQTTIGTQEHLKNPSQVNIRRYYEKYYVPNNIAICLAGDINPDEACATIDRYFGDWKAGTDITPPSFPAQPVMTAPKDTTILGSEAETVTIAWRMKGAASLQDDTLKVVCSLLDNGEVGLIDIDLNQQMRVLGAGAGAWELKDYSVLLLTATPNEGQTTKEARALLLEEIAKLKRGDWDAKLLRSIILNEKLSQLNAQDNNRSRVSDMVDCYINGTPWEQHVRQLERMEKISKEDIMRWAGEHLTDGYACVYKHKGEDTSIVKIDKPQITPIPSNRDLKSDFLKSFEERKAGMIQPEFTDFKKELTFDNTRHGLPMIYKQNTQDERFALYYRFDFGASADRRYDTAEQLLSLLGTESETAEQIKRRFYDIACSYYVSIEERNITIGVNGLQENMAEAMQLFEHFLNNIKPDTAVYSQYVDQVLKTRMEARNNQAQCFTALVNYGLFGEHNEYTDEPSPAVLRDTNPKVYTDLLKGLNGMKHTVIYWGPASLTEAKNLIDKHHKTPKQLKDGPKNKPYRLLNTEKTEVYIAPYDAKNIYMRMISSEGKPLDTSREPVILAFNEYFGGSMNAIVFQELREARGLAYNAWAGYFRPKHKDDTEYYQQHIISQNDKMAECIRVFKEITDTLPQSEALFATTKDNIIKSLSAARTTKQGVIWKYLEAKERGIDYDINRLILDKIPQLSLKDITVFEQNDIKGKPMKYMILGNEAELDMEALRQLGPVHRLSLDDIFPAYK